MKKFLSNLQSLALKVWEILRRFPIIMTLAILVPTLIYSTRYLFSEEYSYSHHLFYDGERINVDAERFQVKAINDVTKIMDISSFSNYQGGACFENYYAICSNNFECIIIYDMTKKKVEHAIYTNATNTDYHCNTCFFGPNFYSSEDKFPLLYISMENEPARCTNVYRIVQKAGQYSIELIQQIFLELDKEDYIYYPNSYYDYASSTLYYSGYTKKSFHKSDDNLLRYFSFKLPDYRIRMPVLTSKDIDDRFDLPSETATQGGFVSDGYLYQTFSLYSQTEINKAPKMRVTDLVNHKIVLQYDDLGKTFGRYDEYENIAISRDGKLYATGQKRLMIYEFTYEEKPLE